MNLQKKLFVAQLNLARELDLPIVIHSREDFDTTIDIIKDYKDLKIYIHCR
jgi:TatD DNase family protein